MNFTALRKDYKAGEKARIEKSYSTDVKDLHDYINAITEKDPYDDIPKKE